MIFIARNDDSPLSRWWWTIDHWNLVQMLTLAIIGSIMILAAGSAVAIRNNLPELHFFIHHIYIFRINCEFVYKRLRGN